jgi:hypothetical protein
MRCESESRTTSMCKSCSCLLSSQRCLQVPFALNGNDFERHMNSSSQFVLLSIIFVITIILLFLTQLHGALSKSVALQCIFLTYRCLTNGEPVFIIVFSEYLVEADFAARGTACFFHLSAMPQVACFECLNTVQLRRTALVS